MELGRIITPLSSTKKDSVGCAAVAPPGRSGTDE